MKYVAKRFFLILISTNHLWYNIQTYQWRILEFVHGQKPQQGGRYQGCGGSK